jgi:hypothetical protein
MWLQRSPLLRQIRRKHLQKSDKSVRKPRRYLKMMRSSVILLKKLSSKEAHQLDLSLMTVKKRRNKN